jgi:hypothetical protein
MYSPYACHDKGSIYESLSFQNHRHLISSKCTYNSTGIPADSVPSSKTNIFQSILELILGAQCLIEVIRSSGEEM